MWPAERPQPMRPPTILIQVGGGVACWRCTVLCEVLPAVEVLGVAALMGWMDAEGLVGTVPPCVPQPVMARVTSTAAVALTLQGSPKRPRSPVASTNAAPPSTLSWCLREVEPGVRLVLCQYRGGEQGGSGRRRRADGGHSPAVPFPPLLQRFPSRPSYRYPHVPEPPPLVCEQIARFGPDRPPVSVDAGRPFRRGRPGPEPWGTSPGAASGVGFGRPADRTETGGRHGRNAQADRAIATSGALTTPCRCGFGMWVTMSTSMGPTACISMHPQGLVMHSPHSPPDLDEHGSRWLHGALGGPPHRPRVARQKRSPLAADPRRQTDHHRRQRLCRSHQQGIVSPLPREGERGLHLAARHSRGTEAKAIVPRPTGPGTPLEPSAHPVPPRSTSAAARWPATMAEGRHRRSQRGLGGGYRLGRRGLPGYPQHRRENASGRRCCRRSRGGKSGAADA